jgi:uroporphyrinogen-III decarboxylase
MTSRERIITALDHRKADRIPRYDIFLDGYKAAWSRANSLPNADGIYDHYAKIDITTVIADQRGPFTRGARIERREGAAYWERDTWGRLLLKKDGAFFEQEQEVVYPDTSLVDRIPFESPLAPGRYDDIANFSVSAGAGLGLVSGVLGLFMGCQRLRGDVPFLMDLVADPVFARELVDRLAEFTTAVGLQVAGLTDTRETAIWVYDELASRTDVLFSPRTFEKIFLEPYRRMIRRFKADGIRQVILHCDGNSLPILDLVVEAGFTGLQSLAPTAGMWLPDVKARYGRRLALIGGMCNIETLARGSRREIEAQARAVVEAGADGGVVIGTHSIDVDVPVANYDWYCTVLDDCDARW